MFTRPINPPPLQDFFSSLYSTSTRKQKPTLNMNFFDLYSRQQPFIQLSSVYRNHFSPSFVSKLVNTIMSSKTRDRRSMDVPQTGQCLQFIFLSVDFSFQLMRVCRYLLSRIQLLFFFLLGETENSIRLLYEFNVLSCLLEIKSTCFNKEECTGTFCITDYTTPASCSLSSKTTK